MELPDIKLFENLPKNKQIEFKKNVLKGNELESIPIIYLPDPVSKEYYFISYSHKNYQEVYSDLLDLELLDFPFWYDRGIPAGSNWKDIAIKYMEPFECKGVVFYISEEALLSDAIRKEIDFTLENEKPFAVIYLGKDKTLAELIERLYQEKKIDKEMHDFFRKTFPEEIIYLKYNERAETKKEKIINNLPRQKLLTLQSNEYGEPLSEITSFELSERVQEGDEEVRYARLKKVELYVDGSNDYLVKEIKADDFIDVLSLLHDKELLKKDEEEEFEDEGDEDDIKFLKAKPAREDVGIKCVIDRFSFANLRYLESVELPSSIEIGECAFGRTKNLKRIEFVDFGRMKRDISVGDFAFNGCEGLESIELNDISKLGEGAFRGCYGLTSVKFGKNCTFKRLPPFIFENCINLTKVTLSDEIETIGESAFYLTKIKSLTLPKNLKNIESYAFSFAQIGKIIFNDQLEEIGSYAFYFCGINKPLDLVLPSSLQHIGKGAFAFSMVKKITFKGTYERFMEIAKDCIRPKRKGDDVFDVLELICEDKKETVAFVEIEESIFSN